MNKISFEQNNLSKISQNILNGEIVFIPTDTLYGISVTAFNATAVEKVYDLKQRQENKPFIILISDIKDLQKFDLETTEFENKFLEINWPAPLSVVLLCKSEKFKYLHRGTNSLAFRMPDLKILTDLIKITGPITSTTLNLSGETPITNLSEAQKKFGNQIDLYIESNINGDSKPSTVIKLQNNKIEILRQGDYLPKYEK